MISCSSGCNHISTSVFFSSWMRWTWSVTIWRRSVIFWSSLANSCRESGWLTFSCSSREWSTVSWSRSMGFTFSRPGRSGRGRQSGDIYQVIVGWREKRRQKSEDGSYALYINESERWEVQTAQDKKCIGCTFLHVLHFGYRKTGPVMTIYKSLGN